MTVSSSVWRFARGFVYDRNTVYIIAYLPQLEHEKVYVSQVFGWTGEWSGFQVKWMVSHLCLTDKPEPTLLCVSENGRVHVATKEGFSEETIDDSSEGPAHRGALRDVRLIGEHVYVAGMGRQVYRREAPGEWKRIDQGVVIPATEARVSGFNSIDGFDENDIIAVGWEGEIWRYNGRNWRVQPSPTNVKLERVICVSPETAYACGQAGTLLQGKGDRWDLVQQDATKNQLWGLEWYQKKLWLASLKGLWCMDEQGNCTKVDFGLNDEKVTCGFLHAGGGVLWSIGDKHLLSTDDGVHWTLHKIPEEIS